MQRAIEKDILFMTRTGNNFRVIPVHTIVDVMDEKLCQCLPGFHAFSGKIVKSSFPIFVPFYHK